MGWSAPKCPVKSVNWKSFTTKRRIAESCAAEMLDEVPGSEFPIFLKDVVMVKQGGISGCECMPEGLYQVATIFPKLITLEHLYDEGVIVNAGTGEFIAATYTGDIIAGEAITN